MSNTTPIPTLTPYDIFFESDSEKYILSIHDIEGNKWIPSNQVGDAIGISNIRNLIADLKEASELIEQKHYCRVTLRKSGRGNPEILALSYRGIIRVAMRSQAKRAKEFRDWAEDVLFDVMTKGYCLPEPEKVAQAFYDAGRKLGLKHNIMRRIVIDGTQNLSGVDISAQLAPPEQNKQQLPEPIRNQLRRIRITKNMSQSDVSLAVFGSSDQYGRMERGIIPISEKEIDLILKALGSNRSELLTTTITNGVVVAGKVFNYIPKLRYYLGYISSASELSYMTNDNIQLAGWHMGCELLDICLPIKESK